MPRQAVPGKQPEGPEQPQDRYFLVLSDRMEGGKKGEVILLKLTRAAAEALVEAGHVDYAPQPKAKPAHPVAVKRG
jgi:hypothetical protein